MHPWKCTLFVIVTGFLTPGWGLTKPQVELGPDERYKYITLGKLDDGGEPYSLDCNFDLDEGEELTSVTWYFNKVGNIIFGWKPDEEPLVNGFLVNRVNLTQNDGSIKFLERHREYEGLYFCQVTTNAASTVSDAFQLVTADFGSSTYESKSSSRDSDCIQKETQKTPAIYPPPKIVFGLWDGENWIKKIPLQVINYSNGSQQYTLDNYPVQVDSLPENYKLRLEVGLMIGEKYVPVWTTTASIPSCTKIDTDDGNDEGDNGGGDSGGSDGDENGANTQHVSLTALAAIVLCLLYMHY